MSMTSIWVFCRLCSGQMGFSSAKRGRIFYFVRCFSCWFSLNSSLMIIHEPFLALWLLCHLFASWPTLKNTRFFLSLWRRSHARSPESRSGGTWCDPELLKELPGNGVQTVSFLHFNMNMFSHASLSWILSSHFQYIIYISKHVQTPVNWVVQKRLEAPHVPTITLGFLSNRRSDPKCLSFAPRSFAEPAGGGHGLKDPKTLSLLFA